LSQLSQILGTFILGTNDPPSSVQYVATINLSIKKQTVSINAESVVPVYIGNAALVIKKQTLVTASFIATTAITIPKQTIDAHGIFISTLVFANAALTIKKQTLLAHIMQRSGLPVLTKRVWPDEYVIVNSANVAIGANSASNEIKQYHW
jgi:hypothetical protein